MLLKNLETGDKFVFRPRNDGINIVYTIENGYLFWHDMNDVSRARNSIPARTYLDREVEKVNPTFDLITALQKMKEGKRVRALHWPKNQFSYTINGILYNENAGTTLINVIDLNEKWEDFQESKIVEVKLNNEYWAKVSSNDITVGCQSFSHSKVKELAEAIKEVTR